MNVLIVGGAGHVGSIIVPALAELHACRFLDLKPVPGHEADTIVGDLNNPALVEQAVAGMDAVVDVALGIPRPPGVAKPRKDVNDIDSAFTVNVTGIYRLLHSALAAGVRRFVYASTGDIYADCRAIPFTHEGIAPDGWTVYGMSKRLGEYVCHAAGQAYPDATIVVPRLFLPRRPDHWSGPGKDVGETGPRDTASLFVAAVACTRPGVHILTTAGDMKQKRFDLSRAREVLGWMPEGR